MKVYTSDLILLDIELSNSFLIGWKLTVKLWNRRLWCHNCRLYNNHVKDSQGHGWSCQVCVLCVASCQWRSKNMTSFRSMWDETMITFVFVISKIIKVLVRITSLSLRPLSWPWLFWISQKPHPIIVHYSAAVYWLTQGVEVQVNM